MPRTRTRLASLLVPILAYVGLWAAAYFCVSPKDWTALQTWAVVLTGLVIIWYTWETKELRHAAYAQMDLQIRPYVVLQPETTQVLVTNFGNGAALHIRVDPVVVSTAEDIELRFLKMIPVLRSGESAPVEVTSFKKGKPTGDAYNVHLDPRYANRQLIVTVRFDDLELKAYSIVQQVSSESVVVSAVA
jgi:hypothetical protein